MFEKLATEEKYIFTDDRFTGNIPVWMKLLGHLRARPNLKFLEIGSFQGRSAVWLLDNVLTHETSHLTCVDTFEGAVENTAAQKIKNLDLFKYNVREFGSRVEWIAGASQTVLRSLPCAPLYDFIYIDGDHKASSVMQDAVLALPLLKPGGMMVFDDYLWRHEPRDIDRPKVAIDCFVHIFADEVDVIYAGPQVVVCKRAKPSVQ